MAKKDPRKAGKNLPSKTENESGKKRDNLEPKPKK
jgi:hypothetical protein